MSMLIPKPIISDTTHATLSMYRSAPGSHSTSNTVTLNPVDLPDQALEDLLSAAAKHGDTRLEKAITAILSARVGDAVKVPNFEAFHGILTYALIESFQNGWIWHLEADGGLYPYAVTSVIFVDADPRKNDDRPKVEINAISWTFERDGKNGKIRNVPKKWSFYPSDVSRRAIKDILRSQGLFLETRELSEEWVSVEAEFEKTLKEGFAGVYRITGPAYSFGGYERRDHAEPIGRKVIMDVDPSMITLPPETVESRAFGGKKSTKDIPLPRHPILNVFDLKTHDFYLVSNQNMKKHVFDMSLREKLVLPESHRDLLDVLTEDSGLFLDDFIEGKRPGNLILCKGVPGVGKTLTAEVYAEITQKPLYSVHAGILGTNAEVISKNLQMVFQRAKRWNCVLLIDEADVFVMRRGDNIENNAVVAEFLRTLEYFDGLLFMTTNRPNDIDDAILSRSAAIMMYEPPTGAHARDIWRRMSTNFSADIPDSLIEEALVMFPEATGRDIKMLLSLALRVSASQGEKLDIEILRRCSIFRGMTPRTS